MSDAGGLQYTGPTALSPAITPAELQTLNPGSTELESLWDFDVDLNIFPNLFDIGPVIDGADDLWLALDGPEPPAARTPGPPPKPLTPAAVAEIYDSNLSPAPEGEPEEPRQYQASSINVDAQLAFPNMEHLSAEEVDQENLTHVPEVSATVIDDMAQLVMTMETTPSFPRFVELRIPPVPIINAWVQLYFEHFHPVFPLLHKPSFGGPETHWLLVFAVAAIGAQFSALPQSQTCSRAMHEIVRRSTSHLCETRNQNSRELWLTQVIQLNQLALRYSGERRALEIAELLQALPVTLARRKRLFTDSVPREKVSGLELPLGQKWQIWALDEERRRTGFAIWLVDSAFQTHFDLTPVMRVYEMQNSFPQEEKPWAASSAQAWASFPARMEAKLPQTLPQMVADGSWTAMWSRTGVLGKSAILQHLLSVIDDNRRQAHPSSASSLNDSSAAEEALQRILAMTDEQGHELPTDELKALAAHRLTILSALMVSNLPRMPLLSTAMKVKFKRCGSGELGRLAAEWGSSPRMVRRAVVCAAGVFEIVRSSCCAHYSGPVLLFQAALVLWLHAVLSSQEAVPPDSPSVVIGTPDLGGGEQERWVESGRGRVKMARVGSICSLSGPGKILDEAVSAMRSVKWWGISKIYGQLLVRLRAG